MTSLAKLLMIIGIVLLISGGILYLLGKIGINNVRIPLGHLPGDINIHGDNFTCMIPIASSILLSILLTVLLNLIVKLLNR
ncbi:MAG: DUF2905 domain-containing protein [Anaerolineales bacterium]